MRGTKYFVTLTAVERRLTVDAMLHFRNMAISRGIDTVDIDRLIQKLQGRKGWWL